MSTRVLPNFNLIVPESVSEALKIVDEYKGNAQIIAGGTDVVISMKVGSLKPKNLIKIDRLEDLKFLKFSSENGLSMGPLTSLHQLESFEEIKKNYTMIIDSAILFANVQILNMATIGGNICNASPAGDMLTPLLAMKAELDLLSVDGKRTVKMDDFYTGPGKTVMKSNEILVEIRTPALSDHYGTSFVKFCRTAEDLSKVSVATVLTEEGGLFKDVRLALGAVAPTPFRVKEAEDFLEGRVVSNENIEQAAAISCSTIKPISDLRSSATYRKDVTGVAVKRAIKQALERSKNG